VVLDAWAASPARFREDANAEEALAVVGYVGRVLIELASNAADAARELGVPARIRVRLDRDELRFANTGRPLTADGVAALASLRASAKRDTHDSVGHFGVGFTAVLTWSSAPAVISETGGVRFSASDTATEIAALGSIALDREVDRRGGQVPVLRLPWPTDPAAKPPTGYATEVRLPLLPGVRAEIERMLAVDGTAEDLFWALYRGDSGDLTEIDLPDRIVRCGTDQDGLVVVDEGASRRRYRTAELTGAIPAALLADRPVEERRRAAWRVTWALPVTEIAGPDGQPDDPFADLVTQTAERPQTMIGAPTPTDEPLTLPARLIGTFPVDDTRRRLAPGPLTDHLLDRAADAYLRLIADVPPPQRPNLLPVIGFPAGPVDGLLRAAILERVRRTPLFVTAVGDLVTSDAACLLPGLGAVGTELLGQAIPGLLPPVDHAAATALRAVGMQTISWSQASSALAGIERDASFWWQVYEALSTAERPPESEDLADIPVPLTNGRRSIGARGCLLPAPGDPAEVDGQPSVAGRSTPGAGDRITAELARRAGAVVPELRIIDPQAAHPLLERLGARPANADTLLADPGLTAAMDRMRIELDDADPDPDEVEELAVVVLDLLAAGGRAGRAAADALGEAATHQALIGELVLTDDDGQPWPAVELLVPEAALASVLVADADRPVVGRGWVERYPTDVLVAAGVRSGFAIVQVADPDDESVVLPDLDDWLDLVGATGGAVGGNLAPFAALADLDLVDPDRWLPALQLIGTDREARACLAPTEAGPSYTGWWLSRHALIGGYAPVHWRLPDASELVGLYDVLPVDLDPLLARSIGVRSDLAETAADDPEDLLDRLADPARPVPFGLVPAATDAVVGALAGRDIDLPPGVRTVTGEVIDADDAAVLDRPWLIQLLAPSQVVPGGNDPALVSRVLDLPLASEQVAATVLTTGRRSGGTDVGRAALERAAAAVGLRLADCNIEVRSTLRVAAPGAEPVPVHWWAAGERLCTDGSPPGTGRAVAWAAGRWDLRHRAIAAAAADWSALAEDGIG